MIPNESPTSFFADLRKKVNSAPNLQTLSIYNKRALDGLRAYSNKFIKPSVRSQARKQFATTKKSIKKRKSQLSE